MMNHTHILEQLLNFQAIVRDRLIQSRATKGAENVSRDSAADTIYQIDTVVEPILEDFCRELSKTIPLVLIAEGIENERGEEGVKIFPAGSREEDAQIRLIVDPIDGTRGIMYDKRSAWALAGVAPNKGPTTSLRDIEIAVMTELPTSKAGFGDVFTAIKGRGAKAHRVDLRTNESQPIVIAPSKATSIDHGFASIVDFFPGTKVLAGEMMEFIAANLIGPADVTRATVFEDQYISTGGQFYEMIVGHDRFIADLRPAFYRMQNQPEGMSCHPYDCATLLIAEEAGVIVTDEMDRPLDGPLDCTTGISWVAYANASLRKSIEPLLQRFFAEHGW